MRIAADAQNAGDNESYERQVLTIFRELISIEPPLTRIPTTLAGIPYAEQDSPRAHMTELSLRETLAWAEAAGESFGAIHDRMELANAEMRIDARAEAENQLHKVALEIAAHGWDKSREARVEVMETNLARSMLERGDSTAAARFLNDASRDMKEDSDTWLQRRYTAALGELDLTRKDYAHARRFLESEIRMSEGKGVRQADRVAAAEYAALDHDLYAELAATWLAQDRPAVKILALWERFRMRSRGLPILACAGDGLDCEESSLLAEQHRLGSNVLIGQILLLDRVLVYRMDNQGVRWSEQPVRRQDVLDAAQTLERAVSSPFTSMATAAQLGAHLSDALLPEIPAKFNPDAALLLEPDPMLQNLSWPVLPTPAGPLGLRYPLAEVTSILANSTMADPGLANSSLAGAGHTPVVDGQMNHALVVGASMAEDEPPLPDALTEAQAVNGFLRAPDLLLGDQATAARVAQRMTTATIFHFAGHAVQSRDGTELLLASVSPGSASLGSASSSAEKQRARPWIDGTFLRQHPPHACRLAVLSACATGAREASWNHPLQDIVETLRSLGVPEVVATRWQIDSEASVPFMNSFYESLQHGSSVAAALTAARRVQSGRPSYASPYYWGAYYVSGMEAMRFTGELNGHL
jgi:CHAT domain-containing protein